MHPEVRSDAPGDCPICGMELVEGTADASGSSGGATHARSISASALRRANVRLAEVQARRASATDAQRFAAEVTLDQSEQHLVTSWVAGRIESLRVRAVGQRVERGESVASLYAPEVYAAVADLRTARAHLAGLTANTPVAIRRAAESAARASEERLSLLGYGPSSIERLVENRGRRVSVVASHSGTVTELLVTDGQAITSGQPLFRVADLSRVWVLARVPEALARSFSVGQQAQVFTAGNPTIAGTLSLVEPIEAAAGQRTLRIEVAVPDGMALAPGMRAEVSFERRTREHHSGDSTSTHSATALDSALFVPRSSLLYAGDRRVLFVAHPDGDTGYRFEAREVEAVPGAPLAAEVEINRGLEAGELVASEGAFLIDSELTLSFGAHILGSNITPIVDVEAATARALSRVLESASNLSAALAGDNAPLAQVSYQTLAQTCRETEPEDPLVRSAFDALRHSLSRTEEVNEEAQNVNPNEHNETLVAIRTRLPEITSAIHSLLRLIPNPTNSSVFLTHCPMVNVREDRIQIGHEGASWFQRTNAIENAYFGARMFECGEIIAEVPPGQRLWMSL